MIKHIMLLLAVAAMMAVMVLVMAVPAFANRGGVKPQNYGDCMSAVATGLAPLRLERIIGSTPKEVAKKTAPLHVRDGQVHEGVGNVDELSVRCRNFRPG